MAPQNDWSRHYNPSSIDQLAQSKASQKKLSYFFTSQCLTHPVVTSILVLLRTQAYQVSSWIFQPTAFSEMSFFQKMIKKLRRLRKFFPACRSGACFIRQNPITETNDNRKGISVRRLSPIDKQNGHLPWRKKDEDWLRRLLFIVYNIIFSLDGSLRLIEISASVSYENYMQIEWKGEMMIDKPSIKCFYWLLSLSFSGHSWTIKHASEKYIYIITTVVSKARSLLSYLSLVAFKSVPNPAVFLRRRTTCRNNYPIDVRPTSATSTKALRFIRY